jgi:N-acetylmuramoyl-L-alanine amidase
LRRLRILLASTAALTAAVLIHAQGTPPAAPLMLLTREGRRPIPTLLQSGQELIALDDVASLFQVAVKEDTLAGGVTVSYKGRTVLASMQQPMASVNGRLVALPAPAVRTGNRWFVPVEFVSRALGQIYDSRIELRKPSRLLIVGDLRVPRVTARIESPGPPTRVVISVTPPAPGSTTNEGTRVLVRIDADALDLALPQGGAGLVEQIRPGEQPTTIAVQLKGAGPVNVSTDATGSAARITLDITAAGATTEPAPAPEPPAPAPPADPEIPSLAIPRAVLQTIVIDPGHGGDDTGAAGPAGTLEKQIALDVARRVKALIEARLGIRVVLTREDDRRVPLDERAALANNSKAGLLISLRANAAFAAAVTGAEVFYESPDPELDAARRAAEADSVTLPVLGGGTRTIDVVRWDLAQARHLESSETLAGLLEDELRSRVPLGPRSLHRAPMRVLAGANMPAALIEMAYLSNPAQEKQAASADYQTAITQAIYETVLRFRAHLESEP